MIATSNLRPELEQLPGRLRNLPVVRGYPLPWFVDWIDGEPEFRAMDPRKFKRAIREKLCWVCGEVLGRNMTFVIGPMCAINRTTSEPPCHKECAEWSTRNCPFLSRPHAVRREDELTAQGTCAGEMIKRNPGSMVCWTTRSYKLFDDGKGGILFQIGNPENCTWWYAGRTATRAEVLESIETGLPLLEEIAWNEPGAVFKLHEMKDSFLSSGLLPAAE